MAPGSSFVLSSSKFKKSNWSDNCAKGCNFAGSREAKISDAVMLSGAVDDESIEYCAVRKVSVGLLSVDAFWFWEEDIIK